MPEKPENHQTPQERGVSSEELTTFTKYLKDAGLNIENSRAVAVAATLFYNHLDRLKALNRVLNETEIDNLKKHYLKIAMTLSIKQ